MHAFLDAYVFDTFFNACFFKKNWNHLFLNKFLDVHAFFKLFLDMFFQHVFESIYVFDTSLEACVISTFLNAYAVFKYIFRCMFFYGHVLDAYAFSKMFLDEYYFFNVFGNICFIPTFLNA